MTEVQKELVKRGMMEDALEFVQIMRKEKGTGEQTGGANRYHWIGKQ
jgi:pentatricopeptide repeat protein